MPSLRNFVYTQFLAKISRPTASFEEKTVIVTGGNRGLGKETVKHIVSLGASKVIIGCRNETHGLETKQEIESITNCSPSTLEVWDLDIESPASIRRFAERANQLSRLDVLINNAGISAFNFKVVYDTERTLAVNTIGTFLLALQLIPKLKETARKYEVIPVMTTVASALYDNAKYPEQHGDDIFTWYKDPSHVKKFNQYNLSKLLQIYTIQKLSAIVDPLAIDSPRPIVINAMDPMFCKSDLGSEVTGAVKVLGGIFRNITARTTEEGSR
ncbi:NAD(P)-binding protein, partial [Paraphaeosphaeria sporulosa]